MKTILIIWVISVVVLFIRTQILVYRSRVHLRSNYELKKGYNSYIIEYAISNAIPLIVIVAGILTGKITGIKEIIQPSAMNITVVILYASILLMIIKNAYKVFYKDRAKFFIIHHAIEQPLFLYYKEIKSIQGIKTYCAIKYTILLIGLTLIWII